MINLKIPFLKEEEDRLIVGKFLTDEQLEEALRDLTMSNPMPIINAMDHELLKEMAEFKEEYPIRPEDMFTKPNPKDCVGLAHQQADDESDAQDIVDMMSESPFIMGERVLYGTSYATVIGIKPGEVLIDYADLSGDTWVDEDDLEEVFDQDEHNFREYNDWKLRGIDKTLPEEGKSLWDKD